MTLTDHQLRQQQVINKIAEQVASNSLSFSTVSPVEDYENDPRICFTSAHFPRKELIDQVQELTEPLQKLEPSLFYYPSDFLHLTIKNVRTISDPPSFSADDIQKVKEVFARVIPAHKQFKIYFYRLLLFPNNLALIGTTDPELDKIILDLDQELKKIGVPDDKVYVNSSHFFCNMTLARFNTQPSQDFIDQVSRLSETINFDPYLVDLVTLLTGNAVFKKKHEIGTWKLQEILRS